MVEHNKPQTIVVRCPNWVGDLIMATPVFECLRNNFPEACLIALTREYNRRIIDDLPWLDTVIPCDDKTFSSLWKTAGIVRDLHPDLAILLPNSFRSWLIARLAGIREIYGYRRGERKFLLKGPEPKRNENGYIPRPMIDYYLEICRWMGLTVSHNPKPSLNISLQLQDEGEALLQQYGVKDDDIVIGLNPGAKFGSSKCWPPEYFAILADKLKDNFACKILLLVGPGEDEIADKIVSQSNASIINTGENKIDLGLLKPLIHRCHLLITNDTGPRHYATAMDIPVVVIMGPTDPRYTRSNLEKTIVLRQHLDCSPCHKKICPTDHQCMKDIKPEDVLQAAKKLLQEKSHDHFIFSKKMERNSTGT
jgi:heptosyltransferase-2